MFGDYKLRRKLFGDGNEDCLNVTTSSYYDEDDEMRHGTGVIGQTVREMRKLIDKVQQLENEVCKLKRKRK